MIAKVIVDISNSQVDKIFDYNIPSDFSLKAGARVSVPFGNRVIEGFCISIEDSQQVGEFTLKDIISVIDDIPYISCEMLELMEFLKQKFYIRYVDSLRLFLPSQIRSGKIKKLTREFIELNNQYDYQYMLNSIAKRAKSQLMILESLRGGGEFLSVLNSEYSNTAVKALLDKGFLLKSTRESQRTPFKLIEVNNIKNILTDMQMSAVKSMLSTSKTVSLLHGVTGSGKTEVYLKCIEDALLNNKTAIMLVPEISLTPQMLRIFRGRFGDTVAMLHSGLSDGEKFDEWHRLFTGEAKVALGARSAIFSPQKDIGVIIVDEEHDSSYISESNPRYNTQDVAIFRAQANECKVILGSATPSIESYNKAKSGIFNLVEMNKRISSQGMPSLEIVDMAQELRCGNFDIFSRELKEQLIKTVNDGNQAMIFLNRRGYSSFMMCKECGYIAKCSDCDIALTYHNKDELLKCHYCGKVYKALTECPICHSNKLKQGKIGTERVVEEINKLLPDVKTLRMDNDTTNTKTAYLEILGAFAAKEAQILVGTQMIAKGHDFSDVTLVGVLDADMSLYFSDYRSSERTYQLITQVAGRAGRSDKSGKVLVQTYSPRHYLFNYIKNYDYIGFYDKEVNAREVSKFPPFTTIIRLLISGEEESNVLEVTKVLYNRVKGLRESGLGEFIYLQAMRSPISRLQNKFRYQILMRISRKSENEVIENLYQNINETNKRKCSVFVEINPQSMS